MRNGDTLIVRDNGATRPAWGDDADGLYVLCRCGARIDIKRETVSPQKGYGVLNAELRHDCGWGVLATLEHWDESLWRKS